MKSSKYLLTLFMLLLISSCSLTVDVDDEDELAKFQQRLLEIIVMARYEGGFIDLEIDIFDRTAYNPFVSKYQLSILILAPISPIEVTNRVYDSPLMWTKLILPNRS